MDQKRIHSDFCIPQVFKNLRDFSPNSHSPKSVKIIYWLLLTLLSSLFLAQCVFGVLYADLSKYAFDKLIVSTAIINGLLILLITVAMYLIYKMGKIALITEFQSLLFSSAMRSDSCFCAIFSKDHVIYIDQGFRDFFKLSKKPRNFINLLNTMGFSDKEITEVTKLVEKKLNSHLEYDSNSKNIKFKFIKLNRPDGFFAVKGLAH